MSAATPAEKLDELLTQVARLEAQIRDTLAVINDEPTPRRSRLVVPECGSESAYQRHRHYGETPDEDCKAAHRMHERVRYAKAKFKAAP